MLKVFYFSNRINENCLLPKVYYGTEMIKDVEVPSRVLSTQEAEVGRSLLV